MGTGGERSDSGSVAGRPTGPGCGRWWERARETLDDVGRTALAAGRALTQEQAIACAVATSAARWHAGARSVGKNQPKRSQARRR
jgi:hypothetical protein